ncbi:hypothetical protein LTR28_009997, partial [Elasticomyces elasticus]
MLHESGTGGAPKYGVIPQMPLTILEGVNVLDNLTYMQPRVGDDVAQVGYYKTHLANGVVTEMAASMHAGLMQYTFPRDGGKYILVDLSHYLPTQDDHVPSQFYSNGELQTSVDGKIPYPTATFVNVLPSDRTGENPYWTSSGPYYDDFYTIWDTFRCLNSFYLLTQPHVAEGLILTLIDIWKHERFMPDGRSSNYNGRVQGGSNADNVLADAYVKGLRGAINWTEGYMAMKTDAEVIPYNNFDPQDLTGSTKEGRGALPDWLTYGFVTPAYGRSISKTVEYSLNDYSLSVVAQGEAPQDYAKYLNRSAGFANGTILAGYDPLSCGECEWTAICYEALPWEYSWTVPFDMSTLISFMGGPTRTESRLDAMFLPGIKTTTVGTGGTNGIGSTLFNPGNEPSFATPFLYNYLRGRQWKSVLRSRQVVDL